jgi:hypothetical protein
MTYTKPEVATLGTAVRVIEQTGHKPGMTIPDGPVQPKVNPAYDLDE